MRSVSVLKGAFVPTPHVHPRRAPYEHFTLSKHEDGVKPMTAHLIGKNVEESACCMWNAASNSHRRLSQLSQACMAMRDKSNKILTSFHEVEMR